MENGERHCEIPLMSQFALVFIFKTHYKLTKRKRVSSWPALSALFRYDQLKPKYCEFFQGFPVAMVTCYITEMTAPCSTISDVSHGTIMLLLHDKVL